MNTRGLLNNTDINLNIRLSVERYFNFLSENIEIFSPNGKYFEGVHVRYVDPKIEKRKDYEVKDTDEEIEANDTSEPLKAIMSFSDGFNRLRNDKFETDSFDFFINGLRTFEI